MTNTNNTNTIEAGNEVEVTTLDQIHGNHPYEFQKHYEAPIAVGGTREYIRYTPPVVAVRPVKEHKSVTSLYDTEREIHHSPTILEGIDDIEDNEPLPVIAEIPETDIPAFVPETEPEIEDVPVDNEDGEDEDEL